MFLFSARFPQTKLLTKIGFYVTQKGPRTHVIVYSRFVKKKDRQQERYSSARILAIEGYKRTRIDQETMFHLA